MSSKRRENRLQNAKKVRSRKREEWDKRGKYRYIIDRINSVHSDLKADLQDIVLTLRYVVTGLTHEFQFDSVYVEQIICKDALDREILEAIHDASSAGLLPSEIAKGISIRGTKRSKPWKVTLRIARMNKRLEQFIGQDVFQKSGQNWALTRFMRDAYNSTQEELKETVREMPSSLPIEQFVGGSHEAKKEPKS